MQGRVAVVCASTTGLGAAVAEALGAAGAKVVVTGRRGDVASEVASRLPAAAGVGVDLLAPGGTDRLVDFAETVFGPVDIMVLNGPGPRAGRIIEVGEEELGEAVDSLVTVHHRLLARVLPHMRGQGWGRVLAIGSSAVVAPISDLALSGIGRAALASYLKMLATEVAPDGVTVNMLLPGRIRTERVERIDAERALRSGRPLAAERAASAEAIPARRYGAPAEFGAVAAFLCGAPASYVTGSAVRCDGGASPVL
ncbi:SDR family oxidoreductase [Streptomyces sp. NBC_01217]|uniref:SDR family oxidoreductase n=1 Tax=Streptomyces sp. NBC_01217 TaxID=2903779 RepID=UPI002E12F872|nr:SDR family oxidoreductase [Streptomyces sp. NBC_01217]